MVNEDICRVEKRERKRKIETHVQQSHSDDWRRCWCWQQQSEHIVNAIELFFSLSQILSFLFIHSFIHFPSGRLAGGGAAAIAFQFAFWYSLPIGHCLVRSIHFCLLSGAVQYSVVCMLKPYTETTAVCCFLAAALKAMPIAGKCCCPLADGRSCVQPAEDSFTIFCSFLFRRQNLNIFKAVISC